MVEAEYPTVLIVAWVLPIAIWMIVALLLLSAERRGMVTVRINLVAFAGALIALVSFSTAWLVVEHEIGASIGWSYFWFLYPFVLLGILTPLAWIGEMGLLAFCLVRANELGATIEPMYGYVLAWISCVVMIASMVQPMGHGFKGYKVRMTDRLLTITFSIYPRRFRSPGLSRSKPTARDHD